MLIIVHNLKVPCSSTVMCSIFISFGMLRNELRTPTMPKRKNAVKIVQIDSEPLEFEDSEEENIPPPAKILRVELSRSRESALENEKTGNETANQEKNGKSKNILISVHLPITFTSSSPSSLSFRWIRIKSIHTVTDTKCCFNNKICIIFCAVTVGQFPCPQLLRIHYHFMTMALCVTISMYSTYIYLYTFLNSFGKKFHVGMS